MFNIAIVEDNELLRQQLCDSISVSGDVNVVFSAANGKEALRKMALCEKLPDVILMDIEMPEMDGVEATRIISKETQVKILILTVFDDSNKIFEAIKAGAAGYLLKDSKPQRILMAIEDVLMGGAPMSPQIATKTLNILRESAGEKQRTPQPADYNLSDREVDVLELLVQGLSYKQIGESMFISTGTVRKHVENVYHKLHIHSKTAAAHKANQLNWFKKS